MENKNCICLLPFSLIIILGLASFGLCIAAEFKKSKEEDLRLEGKLCYLPKSGAFSLSIAALILLIMAQIIGNLFICQKYVSGGISTTKTKHIIAISFLVLSWISFGTDIILLSTAASMNKTQEFGQGWVDGECYIVKDGVFIGSSILVLITISSILSSSTLFTKRKIQVKQCKNVYG